MIQDTVEKLKPYATTIYKSLWQDALDAAFFHIIKHFDFSISDEDTDSLEDKLYRYSTRVVGTILLGKYNHEIEHEISLINGMDRESISAENRMNPLSILLDSEDEASSHDLESCIDYLTPYFILDYKFFKSQKADHRKLKYTELFEKYSTTVISQAIQFLCDNYSNIMDLLYENISNTRYRLFAKDRYKNSLDQTIRYRGFINNTIIYESNTRVKGNKSFYYFSIEETISDILSEYYSVENTAHSGKFKIHNKIAYVSLSGNIVFSVNELRDYLEYEIIGAILAKISRLRVVVYQQGKYMILSSPKNDECGLAFSMFDTSYKTYFKRMVSKRIEEAKVC